jgi:hypothetical protein
VTYNEDVLDHAARDLRMWLRGRRAFSERPARTKRTTWFWLCRQERASLRRQARLLRLARETAEMRQARDAAIDELCRVRKALGVKGGEATVARASRTTP